MIHYQIHKAGIIKILWQTIRRITHDYFGSERVNKMVSMSRNIHNDILIIQLKMTEVWSKLREKLFAAKMHSKTLSFLVV